MKVECVAAVRVKGDRKYCTTVLPVAGLDFSFDGSGVKGEGTYSIQGEMSRVSYAAKPETGRSAGSFLLVKGVAAPVNLEAKVR